MQGARSICAPPSTGQFPFGVLGGALPCRRRGVHTQRRILLREQPRIPTALADEAERDFSFISIKTDKIKIVC